LVYSVFFFIRFRFLDLFSVSVSFKVYLFGFSFLFPRSTSVSVSVFVFFKISVSVSNSVSVFFKISVSFSVSFQPIVFFAANLLIFHLFAVKLLQLRVSQLMIISTWAYFSNDRIWENVLLAFWAFTNFSGQSNW
jgi:hypothetical protein